MIDDTEVLARLRRDLAAHQATLEVPAGLAAVAVARARRRRARAGLLAAAATASRWER